MKMWFCLQLSIFVGRLIRNQVGMLLRLAATAERSSSEGTYFSVMKVVS